MRPSGSSQQAYQLSPEKYQAAIDLNRQLDVLYFVGVAWTVLVLLLLMRLRLRRWTLWTVPFMVAMPWLASLPLSVYRHHLGLRYGISVEPWAPWLADWLMAGIIVHGGIALLVLGAFGLARWSPRRWWLYLWIVSVLLMVGGTYIVPLVFDPLFYRFTPLAQTHPELIEPLMRTAAEAGQPVTPDRIYQMDASTKTRTLNAYMTGFGSTKRIVIWDTTAKHLTAPQIQTVFAHELGHYALGHIPRSIGTGALGLLVLFWLLRNTRFEYQRLPQLLLIVTLVSFFAEPVVNTYSRWQEHEADVFELKVMSGLIPNAGANSAMVDQIMAEMSLDDPSPNAFVEFWLYDHPSTNDRMKFARDWGK